MVRRAIELGLDAVEAIGLASYNTAQYLRLYNRGAIAPGFIADLVLLDDLDAFQVESVYKDGVLVAQNGQLLVDVPTMALTGVITTVHIGNIREDDLRIPGQPGLVEVVGIEAGQITTRHLQAEALVRDGELMADPSR